MVLGVDLVFVCFFFFNDTATTEIYTLSLHDALPISRSRLSNAPGKPIGCDLHGEPALLARAREAEAACRVSARSRQQIDRGGAAISGSPGRGWVSRDRQARVG